jgi:tetratricopeptide (TPR) repeat protein
MAKDTGAERSFIGRAETVEALHRRFADVRDGSCAVTLLEGDTGVGKSALLAEFVRDIRAQGVRVLVGQAPALDDPPPFSLLRSALESARDDPLLRTDENPSYGGGLSLIGFAPGMGETSFPAPIGLEARLLDALGGGGARATASKDEMLSEMADRFLEFTRHGPTVLVLEDLPRGDKSSLGAVEFFVAELHDRPLWILATTRPALSLSAVGRTHLEAFEATTRPDRIALRPMTSEETGAYLRRNDPSQEISPEEVARRHSETGGNPFLLQQLDHRRSTRDERSGDVRFDLAAVGAEERQVLDLAAVLGPTFPFDLLLRASEGDEERLTEVVEGLVGRGFLFARPGERLEFPEDRLREEVYSLLPERHRRRVHLRAGAALEAMGPADVSRVYALARHYYLGHAGAKSVQYNRTAADFAERALAPDTAWDHFSRALESQREQDPDDLDGESELVLELARVTEELGLLEDADGMLREFLDRTRDASTLDPHRRATLEIFLARVLTDRGDLPAAARLAEKVLHTPGLEQQPLLGVGAHRQLGLALYYDGHYAEALAHHTQEIALARAAGNELVIARAQVWRVASLAMLGETQQAISEAREVTRARDRLGSVRESAQAHLFFADILADARSTPDQHAAAIGELAEAIRFAGMAKDPRRIGWAHYKTSELLRDAGRRDEAAEKVQRACEIFARMGDHVGLSVSLKVRGQLAMDRGEYDAAEADLSAALQGLHGLKHTLEEIDVVLRLAQLSAARGDRERARHYMVDLEGLKVRTVRPDLTAEFTQLENALSSE